MIGAALAAAVVGLDSLRENPLRTLLATLGVIIGVGALVAVLSLGDAMQIFVRGELDRKTDLQLVVMRARTTVLVDGISTPVRDYPVFTTRDIDALRDAVPQLRGIAMMLNGDARVSWPRSGKQRQVSIAAVTASFEAISATKLASGRLFTAAEASHNAPVIVLSYLLADELAAGRGAESMIGTFVRVRGLPREVIGVFALEKGERGYAARVPFAAASVVFDPLASLRTPQVLLKAEQVEAIPIITQAIQDWLAGHVRDWERSVEITTRESQLDQAMQGFQIMKLFLGTLAGISLLVGGIGIMNIMLANVTERTREIGVRKAIGARAVDIHVQFLTEAVAVSCFGSAVGVGFGATTTAIAIVGIRAWTKADHLSMVIAPGTVAVAALSAVVIGLVFGTYPARRAGRLSPIDAIRHE